MLTKLTENAAYEIAIADSQDDNNIRSNGASIVVNKRAATRKLRRMVAMIEIRLIFDVKFVCIDSIMIKVLARLFIYINHKKLSRDND
jgi:hypothetical protein